MLNFSESEILYLDFLNQVQLDFARFLLIYDENIHETAWVRPFLAKFPYRYAVQGGENLKSFSSLNLHLEKINEIADGQGISFLALGGGSIHDFVGFISSIYKRGVDFYSIPTTWLCAIDSAHGGKNAMNLHGAKNQIGTFYFPKKNYLIKEILINQSERLFLEAQAEMIKIAILLPKNSLPIPRNTGKAFADLKFYIEAKLKVVKEDPFEKKGQRRLLNLGHTVGHVFESFYQISHGEAVARGLRFTLEWSKKLNKLSEIEHNHIQQLLDSLKKIEDKPLNKISSKADLEKIKKLLLKDKKNSEGKIGFIFIYAQGLCKYEMVTLENVIEELVRQEWIDRDAVTD